METKQGEKPETAFVLQTDQERKQRLEPDRFNLPVRPERLQLSCPTFPYKVAGHFRLEDPCLKPILQTEP